MRFDIKYKYSYTQRESYRKISPSLLGTLSYRRLCCYTITIGIIVSIGRQCFLLVFIQPLLSSFTFHLLLYTISTTGAKDEILDLKRSVTFFCSVQQIKPCKTKTQKRPQNLVFKKMFSINQQIFRSFSVFVAGSSGGRVRGNCFMLAVGEKQRSFHNDNQLAYYCILRYRFFPPNMQFKKPYYS